jgi:hypothetical protein
MNRTYFEWNVPLQSERGETIDYRFRSLWSPDHDLTKQAVAISAAAEQWHKNGQTSKWAPVAEPELLAA